MEVEEQSEGKGLVEVKMAGIQRNGSGPGACALEVVLAEGRRIEVRRDFDVETLARLIRTLVFGLGPATRIYVALGATDMRKGFDGNGAKISIAFVEDGGELHAFYDGVLSGMDKPWGGVSWLLARNG